MSNGENPGYALAEALDEERALSKSARQKGAVQLLTCLNFLGEATDCVPADLDVQLKSLIEQHGELITVIPTGEGFSEDVNEAQFIRVTGRQMRDHLPYGRQFDFNYRGPWLDEVRHYLGNYGLQAYDDPDQGYVVNGLYVPGQIFPVHVDWTSGSLVIGGSKHPESGAGAFYLSLDEALVGINGLKKSANYKIPISTGRAVIFNGRGKLHGSESIKSGDSPRITIACSYWDESDKLRQRPVEFDRIRKTST